MLELTGNLPIVIESSEEPVEIVRNTQYFFPMGEDQGILLYRKNDR